ncbi:glycoside hydrolase family 43 protein [Pleomorphovibrio marinus]|uniref:glycoside hydrolase family 43 protein n=1 Tax=Pleomorphovibrio marinus TaxID=2164132 RepID=UPI000E0C6549|nr:glycoside hydrolase family 43 protein [Pleomorphovibrio marinus]
MKNLIYSCLILGILACESPQSEEKSEETVETSPFAFEPLVTDQFTADPSAHVFQGKIYIYPSHDVETEVPTDDLGSHFGMRDYHVYSIEQPGSEVKDHGVVLSVEDIPWAERQLWAPDAAERDGKYYLYFPAKDKDGIFRIGVAIADSPEGPFKAEPEPIAGSYSIDPSVFGDDDGEYYLYLGGIWGGQLQKWKDGTYKSEGDSPTDGEPSADEPALMPRVAKLNSDMKSLAEELRDVEILDNAGDPILAGDHDRRFFEAAWIHKHEGTYYLSYSTGDTHFIAYATGDNPYGPFTYQGIILEPVQGWTTHHSIVKFEDQWYLFFHDTELSGETHLRNIKMAPLEHREDGSIVPISPMK